ncbi:o-succinylbenzoate--CoA ligase [Pedococcus sp. 5OH_020]|uniref:o-succinylbenzoate--CoA ligase n=1 Tax=Pedococcus sp. 5OH_020 TaxID=2989814 RepID=UPI0022E9FBA7|nr:o-succinylbenzoate--CoA ligase [Pedococcus sp. 5OH_020]
MTALVPLAIAPGAAAGEALPVLRRALDGELAVLPYAAGGRTPEVPQGAGPDPATALVVGTSGSTGTPKLAMLPAGALLASAAATHERLGGPGSWLLAMPPHHIAGVQVLLRCLAAGTQPGFVDLSHGFKARAFTQAAARLAGDRRYTALVPTQLVRLLDDPEATSVLATFAAVLVGGAATPPALRQRARAAGVPVVTTYGMSETSGGCVYDGVPLSCSRVRQGADGRIELGGRTLATGYLGRPDLTAEAFRPDAEGGLWFRTDDLGHLDPSTGRWLVDGRVDDVIVTGGLKVAPRVVEDALTGLAQVAEAVVVATADERWGQAVSAAVRLRPGARTLSLPELRDLLRGRLPEHALPRRLLVVEDLPHRGPGKPDRSAVALLFTRSKSAHPA